MGWEEHNKASVFFDDQDSAYSSGRQTNLANQDPLSRPNDNLDQDLSNGHVEAHDQAGGVSIGTYTTNISKSQNQNHAGDAEDIRTIETFKEDLTTTSSDISTDTTDTHKTSNDDITEKEEGSDYEDETSTDEHEYEIEEDEEEEEEEEEDEEEEDEEEILDETLETESNNFDTTEEATEEYHLVRDSNEDYDQEDLVESSGDSDLIEYSEEEGSG